MSHTNSRGKYREYWNISKAAMLHNKTQSWDSVQSPLLHLCMCLPAPICVQPVRSVCVCKCHWLVWFSSNVVTRAGHLVGVQSKCHRDQCWAVGVAFHICLWRFIDLECLKWILAAMTPTIRKQDTLKQTKDDGLESQLLNAMLAIWHINYVLY